MVTVNITALPYSGNGLGIELGNMDRNLVKSPGHAQNIIYHSNHTVTQPRSQAVPTSSIAVGKYGGKGWEICGYMYIR